MMGSYGTGGGVAHEQGCRKSILHNRAWGMSTTARELHPEPLALLHGGHRYTHIHAREIAFCLAPATAQVAVI